MQRSLTSTALYVALLLVASSRSFPQSTAVPISANPLQPTSFGFSCNFDRPDACQRAKWITTVSHPGTLRMHDTGTTWQRLTSGPNSYRWTNLDLWLDAIAAHQPLAVLFTFNRVACWNVRESRSECMSRGSPGSPDPPKDLSADGSPSFNAFVDAVTKHCSPAHHCVKDYIKYFEMWNEPNAPRYWNGTVEELYEMVKPAAAIIRANVPGVLISTPAPFMAVNPSWMDEWLALENKRGRISDIYGFHAYIGPGDQWFNDSNAPERRFVENVMEMVNKKNNAGWTTTPWMNTETGFLGSGPYDCPLDKGATHAMCGAFMARWLIAQFALGAQNIDWYWFTSIGPQDAIYSHLMQWLVGAHFPHACTHEAGTVECPLVQANGRDALIVWDFSKDCKGTTCGSPTSYTAKSQFRTATDLTGNTFTVPANHVVGIGASPLLLAMQ
ncbi:MAG: hypothetical protein WA477_14280 [Candidatus Sulfotelmatobacter sp.]